MQPCAWHTSLSHLCTHLPEPWRTHHTRATPSPPSLAPAHDGQPCDGTHALHTLYTHTPTPGSRVMPHTPYARFTHAHTHLTPVHTPARAGTHNTPEPHQTSSLPSVLVPHTPNSLSQAIPSGQGGGPHVPCLCPRHLHDILHVPVMPQGDHPTPRHNSGTSSTLQGPPRHPQGASRARAGFHSLFRILYLLQTYNSLNIDCKTPFAKICYVRSARSRRSSSRRPRLR